MIVKDWINEIRKAEKTAIIQDGNVINLNDCHNVLTKYSK